MQSYLTKERPSDRSFDLPLVTLSLFHCQWPMTFHLWASASPALALPSGNLDCWLLFKDFLFRCITCTLLCLSHWTDRTIGTQSINRRPPKKDAFTAEGLANLRDSERETHSFLATNSSKQRLCRVSGVSLIVIGMAGSSGVLHTGSQISPKDLLQQGEPHEYLFLWD